MDVHSTSGEDDIASSAYRRKKRTKHLAQKTQNDTDSEDEKTLESSCKNRTRNRKFVLKESDNSESDDQGEHVATVSTEDTKCSINQARATTSPTTIPEDNQFEAPNPEPTVSKRKTRNLIKQEKLKSLQENDENGFKMDSLLSKHSDLFDCESDEGNMVSAPVDEWRGKSKPVKQKMEREPKTARLSKKEKIKLHSETQRIVRESNICLPKYQPKTKTIDDFLKKLKSRSVDSIKPSLAIKKMKENVQPEEFLTSKTVLDSSGSDNVVSPVVICQEESSNVLSVGLQAENAAVADTRNDERASNAVLPIKNHSTSQKDALTHSQDSILLELDNSQCSNAMGASKLMHTHIIKAVQDVPAPKLCSHAEWEETNIVSPVEELQKRLVKHATIISPEVVEDSVLTRDEWKSILYKQVSERRASERKAIEEATRLDNEEFSPVESEAELTDEESLASGHGGEKEEAINEEVDEVSKEEDGDMKEERQFDWHSDLDDNFSDDDDDDDNGDDEDDDSIEGDEEDSDDDELIVRNKKSTKHLDSDSESELPSQSTQKPPTPVIRNFPFDKEFTTNTSQAATELSSTLVTKDNTISCADGDKKAVDSGLGTSLMVGMLSSDIDNSAEDNSILDGNSSKVDNVALIEGVNPKRPSEDDTNMTINSLLSNATELDRSSRSASDSICHYDEETQFLDANGFLNVKQKSKHAPPVLELDDSTISSQLIQLCSGQFSPKNGDNVKLSSKKSIDLDQSLQRRDSKDLPTTQGVRELLGFKEVTGSKPLSKSITSVLSESGHCDGDSSQLLALCSGNFSSQFTPFTKTKQPQQTSDGMTDEGDSSSDDGDDLLMLTNGRCPVTHSSHTPVVNMNSLNEDSDDEMPRLNKRKSRKYLKNKEKALKRRRLEEFVESEAELSGSDHGLPSDEERAYLDNVEDDEMFERWSGDSDVNMSEDELKKQVNRVHIKYTLADDSANIKGIKEWFLPGGDLYEDGLTLKDGYFRKRKFAHVGSETSMDLFADDRVLDSGDELFNDENSQAEAMRRKQRLEKEEFLSQMRQHDSLLDDENSQHLLKKLVKQSSSLKISASVPNLKQTTVQLYSAKPLKHSCGSFLKRNKDELSKLSSSVTSTPTVNLSSSKNFIFQTGTTPTITGQSEKTAHQLKKSHSVKSKMGRSPRKSAYKRSRSLPQDEDSIFNKLQ